MEPAADEVCLLFGVRRLALPCVSRECFLAQSFNLDAMNLDNLAKYAASRPLFFKMFLSP